MTEAEILRYLNASTSGNQNWVPVEGLHTLFAVSVRPTAYSPQSGLLSAFVSKQQGLTADSSKGIIVKTYFNNSTGEIRTFLAKSITDLPEAVYLQ